MGNHVNTSSGTESKAGSDGAGHMLADMKDRIVETKDRVVSKSESIARSARAAIVARPLLSVGVAFAGGYALFRLLRPLLSRRTA